MKVATALLRKRVKIKKNGGTLTCEIVGLFLIRYRNAIERKKKRKKERRKERNKERERERERGGWECERIGRD